MKKEIEELNKLLERYIELEKIKSSYRFMPNADIVKGLVETIEIVEEQIKLYCKYLKNTFESNTITLDLKGIIKGVE